MIDKACNRKEVSTNFKGTFSVRTIQPKVLFYSNLIRVLQINILNSVFKHKNAHFFIFDLSSIYNLISYILSFSNLFCKSITFSQPPFFYTCFIHLNFYTCCLLCNLVVTRQKILDHNFY